MMRSRTSFCLKAAIVMAVLSSAAAAQTTASPAAASKPSLSAKVETWTRAQWEAAKKEWAKDTAKWAGCQKQWNKHKHEGRKSWPSVYRCMTS